MTSLPVRPYRWLFLLCALVALATLVVVTDAASAWDTDDINTSEGDHLSAFVYYSAPNYVKYEYVTPTYCNVALGQMNHGYMSIPVSSFDDRTFVNSASFSFIARNNGVSEVTVRLLSKQVHDLDGEDTWDEIHESEVIGFYTKTTRLENRRYFLNNTGKALTLLRDNIAGGDDYIAIGFQRGSGTCDIFSRYTNIMGTFHSYLTLEYDDMPPVVPMLVAPPQYSTGSTTSVDWSSVNDLPTGGNRGEVQYQVGVYYESSPIDMPYILSPWNDSLSWTLLGIEDARSYFFRVRARDGSGFASNWSAPVNTTIDNSPPSVPVMRPVPENSDGTIHFTYVYWSDSVDAGIGSVTYTLQVALNYFFDPPVTVEYTTQETWYNVTGLKDNAPYHFRVRAEDELGHRSQWSDRVSTFMDSDPPTVPVPMYFPRFSSGNTTVFSWYPSHFIGSSITRYSVEVATAPDFSEGPYVGFGNGLSCYTSSVLVRNLEDGVTYYYRVGSWDYLSHFSDWSEPVHSTQDVSGPSSPLFYPVPSLQNSG